jgi:hypothetical protein
VARQAKEEKKEKPIPLSKMNARDAKTELMHRQWAKEAVLATASYNYTRRTLPDLPPSAMPDKAKDPRLSPIQKSEMTFYSELSTTVTAAGARTSGMRGAALFPTRAAGPSRAGAPRRARSRAERGAPRLAASTRAEHEPVKKSKAVSVDPAPSPY